MTNTFGNRLKNLRSEKRITGEEFGKILNVTKVAVSNWESDRRFPDQDTLKNIADYFDVSIDYLLCRSNVRNTINDEVNTTNTTFDIIENSDANKKVKELVKKIYSLNDDDRNAIEKMIDNAYIVKIKEEEN
ncbi:MULTISPECIES: helix-turn-helix domain-containing protein [unclassified Clostridioides]|uniref:helix-turn-helix domain-containing protein n=1 Tax=unclassified Clostridioides TaxID=2635829 RepID=UPI001D1198F2|nr:helix-turn-helix transcriptional regulator [Clostridioides sp. ES-S-0171-01]MCC0689057.1 helix-turn-helix transcriptional regulator [Clostridioides sp. ES-S-0056-01]MCC0716148.1 helix-turn-helix transcriptional regulator [Clostridioides sp. ES-S-0077-01]